MELDYRLTDIENTAARVLSALRGRNVIAFEGDMGAGKTTFILTLCRLLGVREPMSSPSFSIINEYQTPNGPVFHIDLYRCKDEQEALRAGVDDCLHSNRPCFVEWPSRAPGLFPPDTQHVSMRENPDGSRNLRIHNPELTRL